MGALSDNLALVFKMRSEGADKVSSDLKKVSTDLKKVEKDALDVSKGGKGVDVVEGSFKNLASTLELSINPAELVLGAIAAIGTGALVAATSLFKMAEAASEFGSQIFDVSEKTGLGAETLSALKVAAEQSGSSFEQLSNGITKFTKLIGDAANGSDEAKAKLTRLGIDPKQAINDLEGSFEQLVAKIASIDSPVAQANAAIDAFGRGGAELLPFIKSFDGDVESLKKQMSALGLTITDEAARASDEFGDSLDTLKSQTQAASRAFALEFMPTITQGLKLLTDLLKDNKEGFKVWGETVKGTVLAVGELANLIRNNETQLRLLAAVFTLGASEITIRSAQQILGNAQESTQKLANENPAISVQGGANLPSGGTDYFSDEKAKEDARKKREDARKKELADRLTLNKEIESSIRDHFEQQRENNEAFYKQNLDQRQKYIDNAVLLEEELAGKLRTLANQEFDLELARTSGKTAQQALAVKHANTLNAINEESQDRIAKIREQVGKDSEKQTKLEEKEAETRIKISAQEGERKLAVSRAQSETLFAQLKADLDRKVLTERQYGDQIYREKLALINQEIAQKQQLQGELAKNSEEYKNIVSEISILEVNRARLAVEYSSQVVEASRRETEAKQETLEAQSQEVSDARFELEVENERKRLTNLAEAKNKFQQANIEALRQFELNQAEITLEKNQREIEAERLRQEESVRGLENEKQLKEQIALLSYERELLSLEEFETRKKEIEERFKTEKQERDFFSPFKDLFKSIAETPDIQNASNALVAFGDLAVGVMDRMANAVGGAIAQWALYGGSIGTALKKALAAELAHVAGVAAVNAIYATALGFMRLAMWDFSGAANAFISAGMWAGLAGGAALGARAVAGDSFRQQARTDSFSRGTSSRNVPQTEQSNLTTESRIQRQEQARKLIVEIQSKDSHIVKVVEDSAKNKGSMHDLIVKYVDG